MTVAVLVLLGLVVLAGGALTVRGDRQHSPFAAVALLVALTVTAVLAWRAGTPSDDEAALGTVAAVVAGVLGGGPVVRGVLLLADPASPVRGGPSDPEVLRGGTWIGLLERIAVAGTLLAHQVEVLAVILALKTAARAGELKAPAAAERFIIGTLASGLWAAGCVGVAALLRH